MVVRVTEHNDGVLFQFRTGKWHDRASLAALATSVAAWAALAIFPEVFGVNGLAVIVLSRAYFRRDQAVNEDRSRHVYALSAMTYVHRRIGLSNGVHRWAIANERGIEQVPVKMRYESPEPTWAYVLGNG